MSEVFDCLCISYESHTSRPQMLMADLVFFGADPRIVATWRTSIDGVRMIGETIKLDPRSLEKSPGVMGSDYVYTTPLSIDLRDSKKK